MTERIFLDVDPRTLRLPFNRREGADPGKFWRQVNRFGISTSGMPDLFVYRDRQGLLMIYDGVTRATRVAKLLPGTTIRVEIIRTVQADFGSLLTVEDRLP